MTDETAQQPLSALASEALYRACDVEAFDFETTEDLAPDALIVGQPRAVEAVQFGVGIRRDGYHVFALGPFGIGRRALVRHFLEDAAATQAIPSDWCYVENFDEPRQPTMLRLPAGRGCELKEDMDRFTEQLEAALTAAFESEEYQMQRQAVQEESKEEHEAMLEEIQEKAQEHDLALLRTPMGFAFAPVRDGEVLSPDETEALPEEEQKRLSEIAEQLQHELMRALRTLPRRMRAMQKQLREVDREVAEYAVGDLINDLRQKYDDLDGVVAYLDAVKEDVVDNVQRFTGQQSQTENPSAGSGPGDGQVAIGQREIVLRRYQVNVIVDHRDAGAAPIVYEENPTYQNLIGKVEHIAQMGMLTTDFSLIRAGALHRANGGYLLLDVRKVLTRPFAWDGLKQALRASEMRIESPGQEYGLISTVSLEPEPIPLDVKVILIGDRLLYYLLHAYDPEFRELFKVMADFDEDMDRTPESERDFARLIAVLAKEHDLRPFDRGGVARVVERFARLAGDAEKLSVHRERLEDLLREAHYWAGEAEAGVVDVGHVQRAIDAQIYRADRVRERVQESIQRGTLYISTEGAQEGQVNGLAVLQLGDFAFGKPNRITARVRLGGGKILDIEREADLGGPIHSKGVLILSGFLSGRYAQDAPLSLTASLVFEQWYGMIEGDSASVAELVALLSAIAEVPVKQSLAVTGSVNQHGQVQPIGGVNEKVEGFFDVCRARGLTGEQGVLIPASNVKHLMLRRDVVEAVADGQFHVYPVETVDEAIELLTGVPAGKRDLEGRYPEGSFNAHVEQRLADFAASRQQYVTTDGQQQTHE